MKRVNVIYCPIHQADSLRPLMRTIAQRTKRETQLRSFWGGGLIAAFRPAQKRRSKRPPA